MSAVTFLVKMQLMDAINILQKIRENIDNFNPYQPLDTSGCPFGYIVLSKDTVTGLYDSWQGGGSLMEIKLEKDVKIPIHLINSIDTDNHHYVFYFFTAKSLAHSAALRHFFKQANTTSNKYQVNGEGYVFNFWRIRYQNRRS